jgi:hypothetical protein
MFAVVASNAEATTQTNGLYNLDFNEILCVEKISLFRIEF